MLFLDSRKHRNDSLYKALAEQNWVAVQKANNVDEAVDYLNKKIQDLMRIPANKTMRMSTKDPYWMTPLVKSMLKKKQKFLLIVMKKVKILHVKKTQAIVTADKILKFQWLRNRK